MSKIEQSYRKEVYQWVKERLREYKDTQLLNCEIKKYKPLKTKRELGVFFEGVEYFLLNNPEYGYVTENLKEMTYRGIVETYSMRERAGFTIIDKYGNEIEPLIPIPLSKINRFDQFEAVFNGLFLEMGEKGIDTKPFIDKWETIKNARLKESQTIET